MVHSAAGVGLPPGGLVRQPPFRAPHHTARSSRSSAAAPPRCARARSASPTPACCSWTSWRVPASALDGLREPLEEGVIRIARAASHAVLPARFQLVAATNPCPCGGGGPGACECDEVARGRYLRRLSGPLLDRFDLRVPVARPHVDDLLDHGGGEPSAAVRARVLAARRVALDRAGRLNAALHGESLDELAPLTPAARSRLRAEIERGRLTGRGYHRVRRVARTVADLAGDVDGPIDLGPVEVALSLRARLAVTRGRAA